MQKMLLLLLAVSLLSCSNNNDKTQGDACCGESKSAQDCKNTEAVNTDSYIRHTVMFTLKHDKESEETKKFLTDGETILSALPMVHNFKVMKQVSPKNNYDWYFYMEFENQAAYEAYNNHPNHVEFVENRWKMEVTDFLEADFLVVSSK